jgi:acyl-CoA reductase-like NAD-dependent aldehyde dehydrogenase
MVSENEELLYEAMAKDMNKPRNEAMGGDIAPVLDECLYFLDVSKRMTNTKLNYHCYTNLNH